MRLKVELISDQNPIVLPINYQYHLASSLYRIIEKANKELSFELHHVKKYKPFTFSWILGKNREVSENYVKFFTNKVHFFVSSPRPAIISAIVNGLILKEELIIAGRKFYVKEIKIVEEPNFKTDRWYIFSTMSPILVRTGRKEYGKIKHVDLFPTEEKFYENLIRNLKNKWKYLKGTEAEGNVEVKVLSFTPKRIKIKENWHRCSLMQFLARGPEELIKFAYQIGWGEKNSMGFGMVRGYE